MAERDVASELFNLNTAAEEKCAHTAVLNPARSAIAARQPATPGQGGAGTIKSDLGTQVTYAGGYMRPLLTVA